MTTNLKLTESAPSTKTDGDAAPVSAMRSSTGVDGEDSTRVRQRGCSAGVGCYVAVRPSECAGVSIGVPIGRRDS
ncbi:unnamed protein product [Linum trigynum]|uniref:Uncharacterized protein n=1 Tax=Linum trigynum TaxID=586398 RepID=A0AAV2EN77_9ROSI